MINITFLEFLSIFLSFLVFFLIDDAIEERNSCFPGDATVIVDNGETKTMEQLRVGDKVLTQSTSGNLIYSKVIMFMDSKPDAVINNYIEIETENPKRRIELTKKHLILKSENGQNFEATFAENVKAGDIIKALSSNGTSLVTTMVRKIKLKRNFGAFAPLTEEGTVLVNGIMASCYALTENHKMAHLSFLPWRAVTGIFNQFGNNGVQTGEHWYVHMLRTINRLFGLLPEIYTL